MTGADEISIDAIKELDDDVYIAEVKKPRKKLAAPVEIRRAAQNRLYWQVLTDLEASKVNEVAGHSKDDWHVEFKKRFLYRIYVRDDKKRRNKSFADMEAVLQTVLETCGQREYEVLLMTIANLLTTTHASVKQFSEYLNDIMYFARSYGVELRIDRGLYELAMEQRYV